jgi:HAD superfamily hydrolase (TIGR01509 family)
VSTSSGLVIFDCDGVLVDSEPLAIEVRARVLRRAGWPLTEDEIVERFLGRSHAYVVSEVEMRVGPAAARAAEDEFRRETEAVFRARLRPVRGVVGALDLISKIDGLQTCVASSGGHDKMRLTLGLTGLWPRFSGRIFSAEDVARGKPAPDLFLHAARIMGLPAENCVVVEDSPAGIEGALAAGMMAIGYLGGVAPMGALDGPGVSAIHSMDALPSTLLSLLRT